MGARTMPASLPRPWTPLLSAAGRATLACAAAVACAAALSNCGSGGSPAGRAGRSTSSTTAGPGPTAAPSTTAAVDLSFLTAWGATLAQWNGNHTVDPVVPSQYWPRLPDNLDTYTDLKIAGGRVVGYVLNLYPAVPLADARTRLANELPLDSKVLSERTLPGCLQGVEGGPTVTAATGGSVLVDFESATGYDPGSISRIELAPLAAGATPPATCAPPGSRP